MKEKLQVQQSFVTTVKRTNGSQVTVTHAVIEWHVNEALHILLECTVEIPMLILQHTF